MHSMFVQNSLHGRCTIFFCTVAAHNARLCVGVELLQKSVHDGSNLVFRLMEIAICIPGLGHNEHGAVLHA